MEDTTVKVQTKQTNHCQQMMDTVDQLLDYVKELKQEMKRMNEKLELKDQQIIELKKEQKVMKDEINELKGIKKQQEDNNRLKSTKQLQLCKNVVYIYDASQLDEYKEWIQKYESNNEQYRIWIEFNSSFTSLEIKRNVINMISELKSDHNVGRVDISIDDYTKWDEQILATIIDKYKNVYWIVIYDLSIAVNTAVHKLIQQYIKQQSTLLGFRLWFGNKFGDIGPLHKKKQSLQLIKHYNQLLKQKYYLEQLGYNHNVIGGKKIANSKQEIYQLMDIVNKK